MKKPISKDLLKLLACPVCKGDLKYGKNELACSKCNKKYPIKQGIPVLLP